MGKLTGYSRSQWKFLDVDRLTITSYASDMPHHSVTNGLVLFYGQNNCQAKIYNVLEIAGAFLVLHIPSHSQLIAGGSVVLLWATWDLFGWKTVLLFAYTEDPDLIDMLNAGSRFGAKVQFSRLNILVSSPTEIGDFYFRICSLFVENCQSLFHISC